MGKIVAAIFEEVVGSQTIHQIHDYRLLLWAKSLYDLLERMLPIQIRGQIFHPTIDNLPFYRE